MLLIHILVAVSSIGFTSYSFFYPSKKKLFISYLWVGLTIATGTYLVAMQPSHLVSACITGLVYLGFVMSGVVATHIKLARQEVVE